MKDFVTVVSGVPRSGTSMMMRILDAGGIKPLCDGLREADTHNPHGYYEFERVKQLPTDATWLRDEIGKAVKVIHVLLYFLPRDIPFRVILMQRPAAEIVASQNAMLKNSSRDGENSSREAAVLFEQQLLAVRHWLVASSNIDVLDVAYHDVVFHPWAQCERIASFLGGYLDLDAMISAIDPSMYRNRVSSNT